MVSKTINEELGKILKGVPVEIFEGVKYYALSKEELERVIFVLRFIEAERDEYKDLYESNVGK